MSLPLRRTPAASVLVLVSFLAALTGGCSAAGRAPARRPALVVVVAVDQLGEDLFERYGDLFTGGFRRLREEGMSYSSAWVDHGITVSHPGHATLATGASPARHGIVDAAFYEGPPGERRFVDSLADPAETIVGAPGEPGVSPRKFLVSTLSEWALAADPRARVVALGSGRYSSLLHAGHAKGEIYWYSGDSGRYVTSSFYRRDDPAWVTRFNREALPRFKEEARDWESTVPEAARALARPDASPYETYGRHSTFPHRFADEVPRERQNAQGLAWRLAGTPMLDAATLKLAEDAVTARELGRRGATDVLSLVMSEVDDIGHGYGPRSQEQLDNLLRLDRELGAFLTFLDRSVGAGRYVLALSADHATPDIPEHRREAGEPARRITEPEIQAVLAAVRTAVAQPSGSPAETADRVAAVVKRYDFVAQALTPADLAAPDGSNSSNGSADPFLALYRHNWRPDRIPRFPLFAFADGTSPIAEAGVMVRLTEGTMVDLDSVVHGSPYEYDRHVPLVFFGAGVPPGHSAQTVHTTDLAPTLARLAGIAAPASLDGRPLL